ncbi:MAG: class I SAM-dependent methyltransferase [Thermoleophilia bacterium]
MSLDASPRTSHAGALFAPLGPTYDRVASTLSFGQDPRWRRFLVSRIAAAPGETVLDVATGTGAVAIELVRRHGCSVVGVDRSAGMLAEARRRVEQAGFADRIELLEGRAEALPVADASVDHLTVTYLLRYVDDEAATLRELARAVRPGGTFASLEFGVPSWPLARPAWELYVGVGLPVLGRAVSGDWGRVGRFLGGSIRAFWRGRGLDDLVALYASAGFADVRARRLSLGGGVVVWGRRGD